MSLTCCRSWVVAVLCSVLNFLHLGSARLSGTLYLAVLERYQVDRSQAALPFILCYTLRNTSGPLVGYFSTKFGIYRVTLWGGLVSFVGIGCCYFAEDIWTIILFWGIVFGFGFGMGSVLIPEILNHHFDKYVSNANGIAFAGECLAGFVLPILLKFSLSAYGTSGTFLILSGLMLNSIPACLMLKCLSKNQTPKIQNTTQLVRRESLLNCSINDDSLEIEPDDRLDETASLLKDKELTVRSLDAKMDFASARDASIRIKNEARIDISNAGGLSSSRSIGHSEHSVANEPTKAEQGNITMNWPKNGENFAVNNQDNKGNPKASVSKDNTSYVFPEQKSRYKHANLLESNNSNLSKSDTQYGSKKYYGSLDQAFQKVKNLPEDKNCPSDIQVESSDKSSDRHVALREPSFAMGEQTPSSSPFKIFLNPTFFLILLTQSSILFIATLFWTIIVDFSRDVGLSSSEEIYVLACLSVLDMIGRLGLGWITDAGYVRNTTFSGLCCFGMGISLVALVFLNSVATIGSAVSVFGLCFGGLLIVCPGVVNDHMHPDERGMALASRFFLFAPLSLSQSPLIGYFRGTLGSYKYIFIILSILCLFSAVTSLLTPYAEKCKSGRRNKGILGRNYEAISSTAGSVGRLQQGSFAKKQ